MHSSNALADERYAETLASQHSKDSALTVGIPRFTSVNAETMSIAALVSASVSTPKSGFRVTMLSRRAFLVLSQVSGVRTRELSVVYGARAPPDSSAVHTSAASPSYHARSCFRLSTSRDARGRVTCTRFWVAKSHVTGSNTNSGNSVPVAGGDKNSEARANCHEPIDVGKLFAPDNSTRAFNLSEICPLSAAILRLASSMNASVSALRLSQHEFRAFYKKREKVLCF